MRAKIMTYLHAAEGTFMLVGILLFNSLYPYHTLLFPPTSGLETYGSVIISLLPNKPKLLRQIY